MPSNAYLTFLHMRIDVLKLVETHSLYTQNKRGRKNLGHLTRSAIVMLCAAWERYNEDLLLESIAYLTNTIRDINLLPKEIRKIISIKVKSDKNEIKPIELAGEGWKTVWLNYAKQETQLLNTPKSIKLKTLFSQYLGIADFISFWEVGTSSNIDDFVSDRGDIAHNGNRAAYMRMDQLRKYQDLVVDNVIEIDSNMSLELRRMTGLPDLPWVQDYSKNLQHYR